MTGIVDSNLSTVVEYSYDAWGKLLTTTGSKADTIGKLNPFLYRGYYYDTETGLYYLNSRYYDAQTGRFLNADDTGILLEDQENLTEHNLFAYCLNNPVNMADDDGGIAWWIAAAVGGAAFDTAAYIIGAAVSGQKVTWAGVGKAALTGAVAGVTLGVVDKGIKAIQGLVYAYKAYKSGKASLAVGKAVKALGHYPAYTKLSTKLGVKPFEIPGSVWNKMTKTQQWAANQKFLDRAIKSGSDFVLATPYSKMKSGTYLRHEVAYLISKGYKFSTDGLKLIKG